jgi:NADPH-dependent 7-cyano-7-deazaguanine reductase QueF-like protein
LGAVAESHVVLDKVNAIQILIARLVISATSLQAIEDKAWSMFLESFSSISLIS